MVVLVRSKLMAHKFQNNGEWGRRSKIGERRASAYRFHVVHALRSPNRVVADRFLSRELQQKQQQDEVGLKATEHTYTRGNHTTDALTVEQDAGSRL